ncbi:hypothetical protein OPV22_014610 [Ensete ventricosum]|uniref:Cupin type-1 domain-containing protein n=1 Tax=Ensete ventricosum TaxID=4639 RepID=A0AAV8PQM1_ENSVE|nr:hypothetical protein OPV22_014610 [Ensete ventricosum]
MLRECPKKSFHCLQDSAAFCELDCPTLRAATFGEGHIPAVVLENPSLNTLGTVGTNNVVVDFKGPG